MSTSSSECECDDYWQYKTDYSYNTNFRNAFGRNPFHPTTAHPLVYYAEVQQPRKHRGRERQRGSPNCFVKAFRWYTKEHVPTRSESPTKHKMTGFAAWLDTKYDEFLQDSEMDSEMFHLKVKQTSVLEAERIPKNIYCDPCAKKRFAGKRSWTKKRRTRSNETRDLRQTSNQSFQYIMQPKETSRPTSECPDFSNVALMASECNKKCLAKSRSVSNITHVVQSTGPVNTTPAPIEDVIKTKDSLCQHSISKSLQSKKSVKEIVEMPTKKKESHDFGCQICEEKALKVNVETQYDVWNSASTRGSSPLHQSERLDLLCACAPCDGNHKSVSYETYNSNLNQSNSIKWGCKPLDVKERNPTSKVSVAIPRGFPRNKVARDYKHFECQCPEEKIVNVDAQTQYEEVYPKYTPKSTVCVCDFKGFMRSYPPPVQSTSKLNNPCHCERKVKEELPMEKLSVKFSQSTAQTSNHAIHLGDRAAYEYPLFLKIVCADKL